MKYLIVDDKLENLNAARKYFREKASYASNTLEGIEKLAIESFEEVISDLEMEHKKSGLDIAHAAGILGVPTYIATGGLGHGKDYVRVIPDGGEIYGSKDNPEIWRDIEGITRYAGKNIRMIKDALLPGKGFPWDMIEWFYVLELGFYQPSNEMKELIFSKLKNDNGVKRK